MAITTATWTPPIQWLATTAYNVARSNAFLGTGPSNLGGNQQYLYDYITYLTSGRPQGSKIATPAFALSSTTMVAINTSTCRVSLTTQRANALILVTVCESVNINGVSGSALAGLLIDGVSQGDLAATAVNLSGISTLQGMSFSSTFTIAAAGSHTFDAAARVTGGSGTVSYVTMSAVEVG